AEILFDDGIERFANVGAQRIANIELLAGYFYLHRNLTLGFASRHCLDGNRVTENLAPLFMVFTVEVGLSVWVGRSPCSEHYINELRRFIGGRNIVTACKAVNSAAGHNLASHWTGHNI
ncbi:MAG: hypothetical protein ACI8S3_000781, partial [Alphaproteobacteria bacterium]